MRSSLALPTLSLLIAFVLAGAPGLGVAAPVLEHDSVTANDALTPGARIRAEVERAASVLGIEPAPLSLGPCPTFRDAVLDHFWYLNAEAPAEIPSLGDPALENAIACLLDAMLAANFARDVAYAGFDYQAHASLFMSDDPATYQGDVPVFELATVLGSALSLADRVDALLAITALEAPTVPLGGGPLSAPEIDLEPVLAVDRLGDTFYEWDYALIVDTVGNDLYDNNAGGGMIAFGGGPFIPPTGDHETWQHPIAPAGENAPHVVVGGEFEDSEILISAALAVDTDGDDTYGVYKVPGRDGECTDELIVRRVSVQGGAVVGNAMLFDTAGNNDLRARVLAQGLGHVGAVGVLYLGPGDDTLNAVRSSQGTGVFGGVGILYNEGGDDVYIGHVPDGGTLNADLGICDFTSRYMQGAGFGRVTGVAAGVLGILRDDAGNDVYINDLKGKGFGEIYGHGIFLEMAGNDRYVASTKAVGYAEGHPSTGGIGVALFYDAEGDDSYEIGTAPAIGWGDGALGDPNNIPPPYLPPTLWVNDIIGEMVDPLLLTGGALMIDGGGDDTYGLAGRDDNMIALAQGIFGVFIDDEL